MIITTTSVFVGGQQKALEFYKRMSVGSDVDARSVTAAAIDGATGELVQALESDGVRCVVAAPSKLQRPSEDRIKTDVRHAVHLARLLRLDGITAVTVPGVEQEAARDLVRAREDCRGDLMRARHRVVKLLLRHGICILRRRPGRVPTTRGWPASTFPLRPPGWPSTPSTGPCWPPWPAATG